MAVLALDIGTSSARAVVFDGRGQRLGQEGQTRYQTVTTAQGGAQLSAPAVRDGLYQAIDQALESVDQRIDAVGTSCFWHSFLAMSRQGRARSMVYTWEDRSFRGSLSAMATALDREAYRQRTGCHLHPSYPLAKVAGWRLAGRPLEVAGSFSAYLVGQLFGEVAEGISMASASGLLNRHSRAWDGPAMAAAGIGPSAMPALGEGWMPFRLRPGLARRWPKLGQARWLFPIGDGAAASLSSQGRADTAVLSLGTSGALRRLTAEMPEQLPGPLFCYLLDQRRAVVGGALSGGGNALAWLHQVARLPEWETAATLLNRRPIGLGSVLLWPHLAGMRSPTWEWDASGAVLGLSLATQPVDLLGAVVEAVCLDFRTVFLALQSVLPARRVEASGGALAAVERWPQLLADALGAAVTVPEDPEGSAWGAARLAFERLGEATGRGSGRRRRYRPRAGGEAAFARLEARRLAVEGQLGAIWTLLGKGD